MNDVSENDYMLTTYDNPINPFTDFEAWFKMDMILGHNTCGTLANEAQTSHIFSDEVNEKEIDRAMNYIISQEPLIYKKVFRSDYPVEQTVALV